MQNVDQKAEVDDHFSRKTDCLAVSAEKKWQ